MVSAPILTGHWLFHRCVPVLGTGVLLLLDWGCRTVYQLICDRWPAVDNSGYVWKHSCLRFRNHSASWPWLFALYKYTYLLSYLVVLLAVYRRTDDDTAEPRSLSARWSTMRQRRLYSTRLLVWWGLRLHRPLRRGKLRYVSTYLKNQFWLIVLHSKSKFTDTPKTFFFFFF